LSFRRWWRTRRIQTSRTPELRSGDCRAGSSWHGLSSPWLEFGEATKDRPFRPQPPHRPSHGICTRSSLSSARDHMPEQPSVRFDAERTLLISVMAQASPYASKLPGRFGRIGFTLYRFDHMLRTGCSPPAAPHPVLPRRSSLRL
jgi:hypothetical protein